MTKHKIGIIGFGFVGAACEYNFSLLPDTKVHIYDKFKASEAHDTVISQSDILFICVPTPMREDGACDTSIVYEACERINKRAKKEKIVVVKSTVPPGTTDFLQTEFDRHIFFFNPEFLTEKNFIDDFANQELIVLGESIRGPSAKLSNFYHHFVAHQKVKAFTYNCAAATAEMVKYTMNCYLATKVTFFNEIYKICEKTNANYGVLTDILKHDSRIGKTHMQVPGPDGDFSFGGKCLYKDLNGLIAHFKSFGVDAYLLQEVLNSNHRDRTIKDWEEIPGVMPKNAALV